MVSILNMANSRPLKAALLIGFLALAASSVFGCQCGGESLWMTPWEAAKLHSRYAVIFEGTLERFQVRWNVLEAKPGDLVPAVNPGEKPSPLPDPHMVATFRVLRKYKGDIGDRVQLHTGFGSGDCGARFAPGLTYLVFADGPSLSDLRVSMCSPGGWIENYDVATDLRYLRQERPLATDLASPRSRLRSAKQLEERRRADQELKEKYKAATGRICGAVVGRHDPSWTLSFFSMAGCSPGDPIWVQPQAVVEEDGSFCSEQLGPGRYYVYFWGNSTDRPASGAFYPGVSERAKAVPIEVRAGSTTSGITFNIPEQKTYSVRGFISITGKIESEDTEIGIALVPLDFPYPFISKEVDVQSFFLVPRTRYFKFDHVVPGRYTVALFARSKTWKIRKVEVNVTTHSKFVLLELVHKK